MICTGDVDQHVRAIADNIEKQIRMATGERVLHREGMETMNWVLLDYVDVVVHVFKPSFREFYRLEDLWGDAETTPVGDEQAVQPRPRTVRRRVAIAVVKPETEKPERPRARAKAADKPARKPAAKKAVKKPAAKASRAKRPGRSES